MKIFYWLACFTFAYHGMAGQSFELSSLQDTYKGFIGETIKVPLRLKNTTDKTITVIIRKLDATIGGTQKNYFCINDNCLGADIEEQSIKIDAGHNFELLQIALEAGLASGLSHFLYGFE